MTSIEAVMVAANAAIALAYIGNAIYIAPRFTFDHGVALGARVSRVAGTLFFATCAYTHFRLSYLALQGEHGGMTTGWDAVMHVIQGVAGWAFLACAAVFLDIRIRPRYAGPERRQGPGSYSGPDRRL